MMKKTHSILAAVLLLVALSAAAQQRQTVDYVNTFIGTSGMGHTFPGACVPFGAVQLSPDTDTIPHNVDRKYQPEVYGYCAGYRYVKRVLVNGKPYPHLYLTHALLTAGCVIEFEMSSQPNRHRGLSPTDKPYSLSAALT